MRAVKRPETPENHKRAQKNASRPLLLKIFAIQAASKQRKSEIFVLFTNAAAVRVRLSKQNESSKKNFVYLMHKCSGRE